MEPVRTCSKNWEEGRTYIQTILNKERNYAYAIDYYNGEVVTVPLRLLKSLEYQKQ
ncbi:MAG: hypothetical protein ACLVHH_03470 [Faecalibacillus intestinalis]|uniref:hypothetical protein n=1 Tax=Faecalibacillus intestinalis TaxID=1982626 RepID=UPI00399A9920